MRKMLFILPVICFLWPLSDLAWAQGKTKVAEKNIVAKPATSVLLSKDPVGDADALLTRGEDLAKDKQSLALLEAALPTKGTDYEILWRAARAYYYVGDFSPEKEKLPYFEKGIAVAKRAVLLKPDAVEGHFWLAANYGGQGQLVGKLKALSLVKKIRIEMQTAVKINAAFENGNAYLALGEIDREMPGYAGGDKKRAVQYFQEGLKVAPNNLDIKVSLAKIFADTGRKDDARRLLHEVIEAQPTTRIQREAQDEAKKILGKQ